MDVSPNITRTLKVAGMICLPVSGVLAGIAGVFFWLSATTAQPVETVQESTAWEAPSPLNIIRTGSLYLDSFKSASLYQTYEKAQGLLYARSEDPQGIHRGMADGQSLQKKPLLAQIADSMAIVPEAQAGTPATTGDVHGKNSSIGKPDKKAASTPANTKVNTTAKPVVKSVDKPVDKPAAKQGTTVVGPSAPPAPVPTAPVQAASPARATAAAPVQKQSAEDAFPDTFKAGSLGQLTQLRAELEQLKMQVTIEETRSKLSQLRGSKSPSMNMPSLDFPPIGMPASSNAMRILSIQSVNGKYSATVGTSQGPKIVHLNDNINGNRVVSISRNSVVISRGQGTETLTIQE